MLQNRTTAVQEPETPNFKALRTPTIEEENSEFVPLEYDFEEKFDVPAFEVMKGVHVAHRKSGRKYYKDGLTVI